MLAGIGPPSDVGQFHDFDFLCPPSFDDWPTLEHTCWQKWRWSRFLTPSHHDWPTSLGENPLAERCSRCEKNYFGWFPLRLGSQAMIVGPWCCLVPILWRPRFVAGVKEPQILTFLPATRPLFCGIGIPSTKALRHVVTRQASLLLTEQTWPMTS